MRIQRTLLRRKQERKVALLALIMCLALLLPAIGSGLTAAKDAAPTTARHETIFANLDHSGAVTSAYVVNTFLRPGTTVVDYGSFKSVANLSTLTKPQVSEGKIVFSNPASDGVFRYQGELANANLPWEVAIRYYLNQARINPLELIGQSGKLRIELDVQPNQNAVAHFAENYMVQISIPLALDKASAVLAPNSTQVVVGNTLTTSFTVLPGSSGKFYLEGEVVDFVMESISIAAMPSAAPPPSLVASVEDGFGQLKSGAGEIAGGLRSLEGGMADLHNGLGTLHGALGQIEQGAGSLAGGLREYALGQAQFALGLGQLNQGATALSHGLSELAVNAPRLSLGYSQAEQGLQAILAQSEALGQLAQGLSHSENPEVKALAEAMIGQLAGLRQLHGGLSEANRGLTLQEQGLSELAGRLGELSSGLTQSLTAAQSLSESAVALTSGADNLSFGVGAASGGLGRLHGETAFLPGIVGRLASGQRALQRGITDAKNGLLSSMGYGERQTTVSFVAPGQAQAKSVQFVLRTPPLKPLVSPGISAHPPEERGVWLRLVHLLRDFFGQFF